MVSLFYFLFMALLSETQYIPGKISKITPQKKNGNRFSIFINEVFAIGISMDTLIEFNLSKGMYISEQLLVEITNSEYVNKVREYLIGLLSRRDHARNELRDKARKKDFPSEIVEQILDELTEKKYLNNLLFAKKFTRDKFEFNKWGKNKIRTELYKIGISESDINIALQEISLNDATDKIQTLVKKNKRKFLRTEPIKRKKKIFDFLLRKGYDSNNIIKQMPTLLAIIEQ